MCKNNTFEISNLTHEKNHFTHGTTGCSQYHFCILSSGYQ